MHRTFRVLFLALPLFWPGLALGQEKAVSCRSLSNANIDKLEKSYVLGQFRVFYTERTPESSLDHRLPSGSAVDSNGNGVPDLIENIARQANAARKAFNLLGFQDPLDSPKFRGVRFIDINVLNMAGNGLAFDSAVHYPAAPGRGPECTLRLDISSRLETQMIGPADNRVPAEFTKNWFVVAHELFHLYQYGQTQFKRSWVNEPTAKWAEHILRHQRYYPIEDIAYTLPTTMAELKDRVIAHPTGRAANLFWSRLIGSKSSSSDELWLPSDMLDTYTDGRKIFNGGNPGGAAFVRAVYRELAAEDAAVSRINDWPPHDWSERDQTAAAHDARLLAAIQRALRGSGAHGAEIEAFLDIE